MSIRWKIAIVCIVLSVVPVLYFNHYTIRVFDGFTRKMFEEQLIDYAHIIGDDYRRQIEESGPDPRFQQRLQDYQRRFQARLMIVQPDGIIRHDSQEPPETGAFVGDYRDIRRALEGRYGARTRLTEDRQLHYYHIALPIRDSEEQIIGVAAIQAHTRDITRAIKTIISDYRIAMLLAAAIAAATAIALAWTLTYRLRTLTAAVQAFARGETRFNRKIRGRDEIARLGKAVEQMAAEINSLSSRQSQMLDTAVHQLKTPLTAIKGATEIIREESDSPETRERFLRNIQISSDRLLAMIDRLGELSRLKTEELRGSKQTVNYKDYIAEIVQRLYPDARPAIQCNLAQADLSVLLHPERMEQAIANIIDNALRHTPAAGCISVTARHMPGWIETSIEDTGSGMEPSDLTCIFDQFFTTVPRDQTGKGGMGLGLTIARSIIENHGGTIHATSPGPHQGARFTFTLPLASPA
ncbi:MAG: ATP-binding protein [Kiritimatiellia bacterium]